MRQFKPGQLQTGSLYNISSSYALTASYASNAGGSTINTGSFVTTSSFNAFTASYTTGSFTGSFIGNLTGTASNATTATHADAAGTVDLFSFGSNVESYVLLSNVIATNGVAIGGDSDLRYNASTNKLTVGSVSATSLTGSLLGTASYSTYAETAGNGGVTQISAGSNILISPTNGNGNVTISSTAGGSNYNTATGSYGSFYDTGSYPITNAALVYSMSFSNTSISNGVYIGGTDKSKIYFTNPGVYNLQFSAQFENSHTEGADVDIWFKQGNGSGVATDIASSDSQVTVPAKKGSATGKTIASWNFFVSAIANDYVQVAYLGPTSVTLITYPSNTHPQVPAVIATANRVDTFLSNTGSFSGSFTGQLIGTASWASNAVTASYIQTAQTASFVSLAQTASLALRASGSLTGSLLGTAATASYVLNAVSSSFSSTAVSSSFSTTASYAQTASYILNAVSSSFATTASYAVTSSFAVSASYAPDTTFPYTGSAGITGSLTVVGSTTSTQIGAGAAPSGSVRLDVRAQGALSTDIGLRVRNSGDTYNMLTVNGDSSVQIGSDAAGSGKLTIAAPSTATLNLDTSYSTDTATISVARRITPTYNTNAFLFTQNAFADGNVQPYRFHFVNPSNYWGYNQAGWSIIYDAGFMWHKDSATFANLQMKLTPDSVLTIYTGSVTPSGTGTSAIPTEAVLTGSAFQLWASGSSGNAKPYFKTQNGTMLWLGDESRLYNVTASNIMVGDVSSLALFTNVKSTVNVGTTTLYALPTALYDGVFVDYTARSGSNARAGQLMGIWSGSAVNYTETTTTDFGSTTAITFGMSISASSMIVSASATSAAWTVKTIIRSM